MKMIKNIFSVVFLLTILFAFCFLFRFMWLGAFQTLAERVELISIGGYLKIGFGLSTFIYLAWSALCRLFNIPINQLRVYQFIGITAIVVISSSLYLRSLYVSKIEKSIYWECTKERTSSIYYSKYVYANNPNLCKDSP